MSLTTNFAMVKPESSTKVSDFINNTADNLDKIDAKLKEHSTAIANLTAIKVANVSPVFTADSTYADFGYKGTINVEGATSLMRPEVIFDNSDALSGNYAAVADTGTNEVYIYAKTNAEINIPVVIVYKE